MEQQSSRAVITPWRFKNEYNFGDFRGDAKEMLRRGYDVHLHFANFGIRKLAFHLPCGLPCDKRMFNKYAVEYSLSWEKDKRGKGGVLKVEPEADAGTFDDLMDVESLIKRLSPLRTMLICGDLRPLFLAWLACNYFEDDATLPPVPAGLKELSDPLDAMAEFYEIPDALILAAAEESPHAPSSEDESKRVQAWLGKQKKAELQEIVGQLLSDDAASVKSTLLAAIRDENKSPAWPTVKSNRTWGELRAAIEL